MGTLGTGYRETLMNSRQQDLENSSDLNTASNELAPFAGRSVVGTFFVGVALLVLWEVLVRSFQIPKYLLPAPSEVALALVKDAATFLAAFWFTAKITFAALLLAATTGALFAVLMSQNKFLERSVLPYSVLLQTTPVVAIAPLLIIWLRDNTFLALVLCAWLVCVFPVISATATGLRAVDKNLEKIFRLYGAGRLQVLFRLQLPSALPFFLEGLRISAGLSLIGAVGGEFVAGNGGRGSGLAYLLLMASYNFQVPRVFAALVVIALFGLCLFTVLTFATRFILRNWTEQPLT